MINDLTFLANEGCLLIDVSIEDAQVTEELLGLATIVIDDLFGMLLAVESLLKQHLLLLTHFIRLFNDIQVLVNLICDHSMVFIANWAVKLFLIFIDLICLGPALIANDVTTVQHTRVTLLVVDSLLALNTHIRSRVHFYFKNFLTKKIC